MTHHFDFKFSDKSVCSVLMALCCATPARADLGFWSAHLVGTWRHPQNGDEYRFNSNATYKFIGGPQNKRRGNVSHSGFWKIAQPTEKESGGSMEGPVALLVKMRSRVGYDDKGQRTMKESQTFRMVVDTVRSNEEMIDKKRYWIGGVQWRRVR